MNVGADKSHGNDEAVVDRWSLGEERRPGSPRRREYFSSIKEMNGAGWLLRWARAGLSSGL